MYYLKYKESGRRIAKRRKSLYIAQAEVERKEKYMDCF